MCDVTNPLCGEKGATYTLGNKKEALRKYSMNLKQECRITGISSADSSESIWTRSREPVRQADWAQLLWYFWTGSRSPVSKQCLTSWILTENLTGVSLVVTGEGAADRQSVCGKVMQGVGMRCKKHNIPAVAIVGNMGEGAEDIYNFGINSILTTVNRIMPLHEALDRADELYLGAARRMFRMLKTGMNYNCHRRKYRKNAGHLFRPPGIC